MIETYGKVKFWRLLNFELEIFQENTDEIQSMTPINEAQSLFFRSNKQAIKKFEYSKIFLNKNNDDPKKLPKILKIACKFFLVGFQASL